MMGAICFIPKYSHHKYLNQIGKELITNELPYADIFNPTTLMDLWKDLVKEIHGLYCQVHKINQSNPLYMVSVASAYSLPKYLIA